MDDLIKLIGPIFGTSALTLLGAYILAQKLLVNVIKRIVDDKVGKHIDDCQIKRNAETQLSMSAAAATAATNAAAAATSAALTRSEMAEIKVSLAHVQESIEWLKDKK